MSIDSRAESPVAGPVAVGVPVTAEALVAAVPRPLLERVRAEPQRAFPAIAKQPDACALIAQAVRSLPSVHRLHLGDSRRLELEPETVELVVTSPPYWTLKKYNDQPGQLGEVEDYDGFLDAVDEVWRRVHDALVPGGRMVVAVCAGTSSSTGWPSPTRPASARTDLGGLGV